MFWTNFVVKNTQLFLKQVGKSNIHFENLSYFYHLTIRPGGHGVMDSHLQMLCKFIDKFKNFIV